MLDKCSVYTCVRKINTGPIYTEVKKISNNGSIYALVWKEAKISVNVYVRKVNTGPVYTKVKMNK